MHSGLLGEVVPPLVFLSVWLAYGFAAGHLCGLLFRKTIVAGTVALLSSSLLVFVWVPSLFAGGLQGWQVFGAPLALVAAARLLLWRWASDRLASKGTYLGLGLTGVFCVGWAALGLWWRVAEPPEVVDRLHIQEYAKKTLPDPEHNAAGIAIRGALSRVGTLARDMEADRPINQQPVQPGMALRPDQGPPHVTFRGQLQAVLEDGWQEASPELAQWLDGAFDNVWPKQLAEAAGEPLGLVHDPRNLSASTRWRALGSARFCATLLMARGLQKESEGDPAAFVHNLRSGLALARNLRHLALSESVDQGIAVEEICTRSVERWLERLRGRPDLLKQALALLLAHERETPGDTQDQEKGEYLIALNSLNDVESWLPHAILFADPTGRDSAGRDFGRVQVALVNYSLLVPWERERQLCLLRAMLEGDEPQRRAVQRMGGPLRFAGVGFGRRPSFSKRVVARLRATQLQVALRLYEAEAGRPAKALDALLQKRYFEAIPADPFDGRPFRYRLSKGEKIEWPEIQLPPGADMGAGAAPMMPGGAPAMPGMAGQPGPVGGVPDAAAPPAAAPLPGLPGPPGAGGMGGPAGMAGGGPAMPGGPGGPVDVRPEVKEVPAGQGILWSVGEDGEDDGGLRRPRPDEFTTMAGQDLIYLVPLPPGPPGPPKKPARR
jgi:hypothetical protein